MFNLLLFLWRTTLHFQMKYAYFSTVYRVSIKSQKQITHHINGQQGSAFLVAFYYVCHAQGF